MSLRNHSQSCHELLTTIYNERAIGRVQRDLDHQSTKQLVHVLVISRLDACKRLLYGLPDTLLKQLQRVQNACARMVMKCTEVNHITPLLKENCSILVKTYASSIKFPKAIFSRMLKMVSTQTDAKKSRKILLAAFLGSRWPPSTAMQFFKHQMFSTIPH